MSTEKEKFRYQTEKAVYKSNEFPGCNQSPKTYSRSGFISNSAIQFLLCAQKKAANDYAPDPMAVDAAQARAHAIFEACKTEEEQARKPLKKILEKDITDCEDNERLPILSLTDLSVSVKESKFSFHIANDAKGGTAKNIKAVIEVENYLDKNTPSIKEKVTSSPPNLTDLKPGDSNLKPDYPIDTHYKSVTLTITATNKAGDKSIAPLKKTLSGLKGPDVVARLALVPNMTVVHFKNNQITVDVWISNSGSGPGDAKLSTTCGIITPQTKVLSLKNIPATGASKYSFLIPNCENPYPTVFWIDFNRVYSPGEKKQLLDGINSMQIQLKPGSVHPENSSSWAIAAKK
ncbi:hypothetical protein WDW37_12205 [Bdellovibrionota bacterium FG-1]